MKLEEWQNLNSLASKSQQRRYHKGCAKKQGYATREDAQKHLHSGYFLNPEELDCYRCRFCHWFHLGHRPGLKKKLENASYSAIQRKNYLNHIRRLQLQNQILASVLADERKARQLAWVWYQNRLRSKLDWIFDLLLIPFRR